MSFYFRAYYVNCGKESDWPIYWSDLRVYGRADSYDENDDGGGDDYTLFFLCLLVELHFPFCYLFVFVSYNLFTSFFYLRLIIYRYFCLKLYNALSSPSAWDELQVI